MKLLIIRHGDPDYSIDSLTEKGFREARLLKDRLVKLNINAFYCSPLGRAKATARPTLDAYNTEAVICDWLMEFDGYAFDPENGERTRPWDRLPRFMCENEDYYDKDKWIDTPFIQSGNIKEKFKAVCDGLDEILKNHGYAHEGKIFKVEKENTDTVALFCHFGVECVLLSHLLKISPMALWQGFTALTSSVTTLITEEREQGTAYFRCCGFSDISHLYAGNEPPSFQARFCETYSNFDERH